MFKIVIHFAACFLMFCQSLFAQIKFSKVKIDKQFRDTLTFINHWDYPVDVLKDDSTGEFEKLSDGPITPADTAHLYFTANCTTNIQGGYEIRYCFAYKEKRNLVLKLTDGLPAYASEFYFYIKGDSFYFHPNTIYPIIYPEEKTSYYVTWQKITLNQTSYNPGDIIIGYIDTEFIETVSIPKKGTASHKFYLKGFIKTRLVSD